MQRGISLVELAQKITAEAGMKADYVVPSSQIKLSMTRDEQGKAHIGANVADRFDVPAIRPVAHDQIGTYTGVPARYYDKMLAEAPELLVENVNTWMRRQEEPRMIRTLGGDMRAFLSNRYQRVENSEIAEVVLPALMETGEGKGGIQIVSAEVTERRMYITAIFPGLQREIKGARVGDVVQAGVTISNSEVGLGAVSVSPLVWRLACLNGMKVADGKLTARHVGRRLSAEEDLNAMFTDETRKADDHALLLKVRDVVRGALDEARFSATVDKMSTLTEGKIVGDPTKAVEVLAQKVGATEAERGGILRSLIEGGDLSAWGMVNAITHQAHNTGLAYDRSMEFVAAGGQLLELPKTEWKRILEAA